MMRPHEGSGGSSPAAPGVRPARKRDALTVSGRHQGPVAPPRTRVISAAAVATSSRAAMRSAVGQKYQSAWAYTRSAGAATATAGAATALTGAATATAGAATALTGAATALAGAATVPSRMARWGW